MQAEKLSRTKLIAKDIDDLMKASSVRVERLGEKTTAVILTLPNGFAITETSSCVDPANYDQDLGRDICLERIRNKVWELEGYLLQERLSPEPVRRGYEEVAYHAV